MIQIKNGIAMLASVFGLAMGGIVAVAQEPEAQGNVQTKVDEVYGEAAQSDVVPQKEKEKKKASKKMRSTKAGSEDSPFAKSQDCCVKKQSKMKKIKAKKTRKAEKKVAEPQEKEESEKVMEEESLVEPLEEEPLLQEIAPLQEIPSQSESAILPVIELSGQKKLYQKHCALCHADNGNGKNKNGQWLPVVKTLKLEKPEGLSVISLEAKALTDEKILVSMSEGKGKMKKMTDKLTPREMKAMVEYTRHLQAQKQDTP